MAKIRVGATAEDTEVVYRGRVYILHIAHKKKNMMGHRYK